MDASVLDRLEALTPHARKTLLSRLGEAEPPIRAELFGIQRFEEHGRSLAQAQVVEADGNSHHHLSFFPRVEENLVALREAYDYHTGWVQDQARAGFPLAHVALEAPDAVKARTVADFLNITGKVPDYPHSNRAK